MYKRIKELRKEQERTQINVSTLIGMDQSNYSKLERGENPVNLEFLLKIAELYNVSLDYLTERTNKREVNR